MKALLMIAGLAACGSDGVNHLPDAPGNGSAMLTAVTLYRTDPMGTNLASSGGHINDGVWTTQAGAQNVPGNDIAHLFLATSPTTIDYLAMPLALSPGANIIYFFADSDDQNGGSYGFAINAWFDGAAPASPSMSVFAAVGGQLAPDGSTTCTAAFDGTCAVGANTWEYDSATAEVSLVAFAVTGVGGTGASPCTDRIGKADDMPDGICDTTGSFTLMLQ